MALPTFQVQKLIKPRDLFNKLPLTQKNKQFISDARCQIADIMKGKDPRLLVIVGPCSIHDPIAAYEYANLLKTAIHRFHKNLFIVMRTYFEKPRTTVGWKGLISDPYLNGSFVINDGLVIARQLLLDLCDLEIPTANEFLDPIIPQYISDLIALGAIGARTSASQLHRELASSLPMPIGFKNNLDGNLQVAMDAVLVASHMHSFLSIQDDGTLIVKSTTGNQNCHIILRGSNTATNYSKIDVERAISSLLISGLYPYLTIDCNHGNSFKNYLRQKDVVEEIVNQILQGTKNIKGIMLESHLIGGKQELTIDPTLIYGQSITDGCLAWEDTLPLLEKLAYANSMSRI